MSFLAVEKLVKRYGAVTAVANVDFEIDEGTFVSLLGPSGCGKTTTLRCIAGLETPDEGTIRIGETEVFSATLGLSVPIHSRKIGMVFQNYALWPHMTVFENIAFPLRVQHYSRADLVDRVGKVLEMLGIQGLERRYPSQISGGQQQRVALARALVHDSQLLLFDEPLSNLDAKLREQAIGELKEVHRTLGKTIVYVTHNQVEALAMSDVMAVMRDGAIRQIGRPREIYERPTDMYVANFVGKVNTAEGTVLNVAPHSCQVSIGGTVVCGVPAGPSNVSSGDQVDVFFRPEVTMLREDVGLGGANAWEGRVESVDYLGDRTEYLVDIGALTVRVNETRPRALAEGDRIAVAVEPEDVRVVLKSSGR